MRSTRRSSATRRRLGSPSRCPRCREAPTWRSTRSSRWPSPGCAAQTEQDVGMAAGGTIDDLAVITAEATAQREALAASAVARVLGELELDHATRRNLEVGTLAAVDVFLELLA